MAAIVAAHLLAGSVVGFAEEALRIVVGSPVPTLPSIGGIVAPTRRIEEVSPLTSGEGKEDLLSRGDSLPTTRGHLDLSTGGPDKEALGYVGRLG